MPHSAYLVPFLAATIAAAAGAQTVVVPDNCNLIGPSITTSTWRSSSAGHFQVAYDASNFTAAGVTGPVLVTRLRFRGRDGQPDLGGQGFAGATVQLGESAVDYASMTTTFANNRGPMGPVGVANPTLDPVSGSVPNDYSIDIDLVAAGASHVYDPTLGNDLLIEITHNAPANTPIVTLAAGSGTVATARGRMVSTSNLASATGSLLAPPVIEVGFTGPGGYAVSQPARLERIGHGCGGTFQSFYQDFQPSEPFDLANTSILMIPNNVAAPTSYSVVPGNTPPDLTKLNATPNSVAESAMISHPLGFTFAYVSGSTTSIGACSEGFVWLDAAMTTIDATPSVNELLGISIAQTARVAPLWFNLHLGRNTALDPNAGLHVMTDTSGGPGNAVCYVTWYKVGLSVTTAVAGASVNDMQVVLHEATGIIEMRYGNLQVGPGTLGITGFSPGRIGTTPSTHPGPRNLSHELPLYTAPDTGAHALSHGTPNQARPVMGQSITFQSYNQPAGTMIGLLCLDLAALQPAMHVAGVMAPGCGISMSPTFLVSEVVIAPTGTWSSAPLPVSPAWIGLSLYSQYFAADANLLLTSSNALKHTVGLE